MPGTPYTGCTDGNGDGPSSAVPVFFFWGGAEEGCPPLRACRAACRAIRRPVPFQGEVQANAASVPRAHLPLGGWGVFRQGNAGNLKHGILP